MTNVDRQLNAERQAAHKNRKLAERYPLMAWSGELWDFVEPWTAERHIELQDACLAGLNASLAAGEQRMIGRIAFYNEVLLELIGVEQMAALSLRWNSGSVPKKLEYCADFWYQRLKEALGYAPSCPDCGDSFVTDMHQSGDPFHWWCAGCKRTTPLTAEERAQPPTFKYAFTSR